MPFAESGQDGNAQGEAYPLAPWASKSNKQLPLEDVLRAKGVVLCEVYL